MLWVDDGHTLWADRNRDTWQLPLISSDGAYCGNVVAQVVDPKECLVRYFVIFSHEQERHFLLPSEAVAGLDTSLHCTHSANSLKSLPAYQQHIPRNLELQIHDILERDPYWLEGFSPPKSKK